MDELSPDECELRGSWLVKGDRAAADPVEQRIEWLTEQRLQQVAKDPTGWETLYKDSRDGRYWELTFPEGEMHGGGPRRLHTISEEQAAAKYPNATL